MANAGRLLKQKTLALLCAAGVALLPGCWGVRVGVGPNVDTLGHVGLDVKLQVHVEVPTDLKKSIENLGSASVESTAVGVVAAFGGGTSNRVDENSTNAVSGHIIGYAGVGVSHMHSAGDRVLLHHISIMGGRRQFFGYTDSDTKGTLALQYSPMFNLAPGDGRAGLKILMFPLYLGPELQTDILFESLPGGSRTIGVFTLSVVGEFYSFGH